MSDNFLDLLVVRIFGLEKKDIYITHGSEFAATVATESHEAKAPGKGLAYDFPHDAFKEFADQDVDHVGALSGNFPASTAGEVPRFKSIFLDLTKAFEKCDRIILVRSRLLG